MADGMLSLSWNNHSTTFCHMLSQLRHKEKYTDATVACEGRFYPVHKLVLSTCSQYFEDMFEHTLGKHPVVLLQDVRRDELEALLSYMYAGIVSVAQRDLARLIKVAELLQIKGLAVPDEIPADKKSTVNNRSLSSERSSPQLKMARGVESIDDINSPYPKRRRREDNETSSHGGSSPTRASDSPKGSAHTRESNQMLENSKASYQGEGENLEDVKERLESVEDSASDRGDNSERTNANKTRQRGEQQLNQRLTHQSGSQDSSRNQYKDGGDEAIVIKEEAWEDPGDNQINSLNTSMSYDPASDEISGSAIDGAQDDSTKLLLPKEYESQGHHGHLAQALPEVVVEALAGPSGMHEWLGGGDFTAGLSGVENYSGEGSPPTADHPQQHQLAGDDRERPGMEEAAVTRTSLTSSSKLHQCTFCSYFTPRKDHLIMHIRTHTGEKPFACPYCPSRFVQKGTLSNHIRTHTGEKPFSCPFCPQSFARNSHLRSHMSTHKTFIASSNS
ncbi:zinc finger and BTB domain-containing protein 7A isoform X5 [Procambarus clarkii]|uniref:zinc finger and BTB domain-containing protein 7A isoform X5 n=1 Tax=Procambarus clarkii TaxID=6728 RepID=UPI001E67000D|nr:zinc finger and BTB domain-containing protein 7A-like isoform X5 [Procambarus clarkii]